MSESHGFNTNKIFIILFVLTALEVGWAEIGLPRWAAWSGLLIFAYMKGHLIFTYFMHMKFEGWIVKGLMVPTIPLMMIVVFANMPDTSKNELLVYPLTEQLNEGAKGKVGIVTMSHTARESQHADDDEHGGGGH